MKQPGSLHTGVVVVGGGLTGLTLAFYLQRRGVNFILVERENRTGGVIRTYSENGFVYEAGPNTGVLADPAVAELFDELTGICRPEFARDTAKSRWIWKGDTWHALPANLREGLYTPLFSRKDKFRILGEPFRKKGNDPFETVSGLVNRRLGESYLQYAVDPFISGIYAGDPQSLVTRYALPKLYRLEQEYGSFIRGALMKMMQSKSDRDRRATREVFSVSGGLQNLTDGLMSSIHKDNLLQGCGDIKVHTSNGGFLTVIPGLNTSIRSEKLVTTVGAYALPGLLPEFPAPLINSIAGLRYAGIVQVAVGFKNWTGRPLPAFGGLVPYRENRRVLGVLFPSSIFSGRAPEGGALLSVFLGGIRNPGIVDWPDIQVEAIVMKEISDMLNVNGVNPDLLKIFRYRTAIPQYEKSSAERLEAVDRLQRQFPGLTVAGNLRDGIGIADRIRQAAEISKTFAI